MNAHTERTMLDRLNTKYSAASGNGFRYARAEHVKVTAGHDASRICDYMAMDLWPGYGAGAGPKLHGHEVKVSRADWLTELKDPTKAEAFARYCDYWWLVAAPGVVVNDEDLPAGWGLMEARRIGLSVVIPATLRPDPEPMGRDLQATFARAVTKTAVRITRLHPGDRAIRQVEIRAGIPRLTPLAVS